MTKKELMTDRAPRAIGPYSQAVMAKGVVFLSGQIPIDPSTGDIVSGGVASQTRQVLRNLQKVLEEAGGGLNDVVKTTVFLTDLGKFSEMNTVYGEFFGAPYPARATVGVNALPKGVEIEIDAIAVLAD